MLRQVLVLSILAAPAWAHAEGDSCTALLDPASPSLESSGLDQGRAACGATMWSIGTRGISLDADSYTADLLLDLRFLDETGFEFGIGARLLGYQLVRFGDVEETSTDFGPVRLFVARPDRRRWWGQPAYVSHVFSIEVPYSNTANKNFSVLASPGIVASLLPSERLQFHGKIAGLLRSTLLDDGPDTQAALSVSADLGLAPVSTWALLLGGEAQGGDYGVGLDHLIARGGTRVGIGNGALEVSVAYRVAGDEPKDSVFWIGYRHATRTTPSQKPHSRLLDWAQ